VVQKASYRSPEFIGFFAPISEIRGYRLLTRSLPERFFLKMQYNSSNLGLKQETPK
jgi:hypothetical protein